VKGCQRSNQRGVFAPSFFILMAFGMIVSIGMGCDFGGKKIYRLGFTLINLNFMMGLCLLVHLREFHNQRSWVRYTCLTSSLFLPSTFQKKGMSSSSDNVSLSSSNSASMESKRSVGRHVEEESTSPTTMVGRIPMETVTEVREDPLEEIAESN